MHNGGCPFMSPPPVALDEFHQGDGQAAEKESEEDILVGGVHKGPGKGHIKGNFRDRREDQEAAQILPAAFCIVETLSQKEAENWESDAADASADLIARSQRHHGGRTVDRRDVINQHRDDGENLQESSVHEGLSPAVGIRLVHYFCILLRIHFCHTKIPLPFRNGSGL